MKLKSKKTFEICFITEREGTIDKAKDEIKEEMISKGIIGFRVRQVKEPRTEKQNRSLYLWFKQVADGLNDAGATPQQIFSKPVEQFWTPELIKEMWKKAQKAMFNKKSTTQLFKTGEIDKIYDVFNKVLAERAEVQCPPFPNKEEVIK